MSGVKKYGNLLIKGTLAVSVANATTKLVGFILIPLFTYYLTPEDYGTVALVSLVVTALNLFYNPGMLSATMRLYHSTDDENYRKELIGSAHRFFLFIPLFFILLSLLVGPFLFSNIFTNFQFYPYGLLAVVLAFFSQPKRIWVTLMTLQYKVHITAFYSALSVILGLATTAILVIVFKMGAMGKVIGMFPTVLIFFFLSFTTIRKYTGGLWSFRSMKEQLVFGFPLILAIWSYEFLHVADRYILERMTDMHQVGIYAFGYHLAELPMFLVLGMKQMWNPIFYEAMNKKEYHTLSKLINYFTTGLTLFNLLIILFCKEVILAFINERYYEAIPVVGVIIVGIFFNGLLTISNSILAYKNKFGVTSGIATIATLLNVGLNILWIPDYGIMGSAWATLIAYFVYFVMGLWLQRDTIRLLQKRTQSLIPIVSIFGVMILNLFLFKHYGTQISGVEILIKSVTILLVGLLFFRFGLISPREIRYAWDTIANKIRKRSQKVK